MLRFYVETSAANYFMDIVNGEGAMATRKLQLSKGREWYTSTTVLWELMQIREHKELDASMYLASCLFSEDLLKSAAEIILDYISQGKPKYQLIDPFTKSEIGPLWKRACNDKGFCFFLDSPGFKYATSLVKDVSRYVGYLTHNKADTKGIDSEFVESLSEYIDNVYESHFVDEVDQLVCWLRKTSILIIFLQLCLGIDVAKDVIDEYWDGKGINDPIERMAYLLDEHIDIVRYGPVWNVANAIFIQCFKTGLSSRGAFHDGLHAIYLPFIDVFLTRDEHFRKMRESATKPLKELYNKIHHLDELEFQRVDSQ